MGSDTLREVRDGPGHSPGGTERVGTPSGRSEMGQNTYLKHRKGSGHPLEGTRRVGTLSEMFGTDRDTLQEVREIQDTLQEVRYGS